MAKADVEKSEETNTQINSNTECTPRQQIVEKANERPEWLPNGWTVDFRTRKSGVHMGSGYKCYIEPFNGYKFYSKPEVLRYLETKNDNSCTPKKEKKCPNTKSPSNVVIDRSTAEDLPPGWIKEVKIRKNGNGIRKDPFYKDPVSGYVFRSKKDALRYLASGDIGTCAFRPSRRQIQDEDKLTPSPAAKRQKLKRSAPKQQLFAGKAIFDKSSVELQDANSSRKGQDEIVQSGTMVAPVPTGESVVKMHSLEDGAENLSEMKKISDPDDVQEKEHVGNMMENANEENQINPSISKKEEEFNVHHRFSPRLAGVEPVQLANNEINEQTLQVPKRNLRKSRTTLDADLENKSSHRFGGVPEIEHEHKMQQEVIKTSSNLSEDQAVAVEQPNKLETDEVDDNKPEIYPNSNKSNNKSEYHIPRRASKRLAGFDHELVNNSISCDRTPKYESRRSKDEINAELQQSEGGLATELADRAPINGEPANERRKSSKIPPITGDQLEKLRGEEMGDEKSEAQVSFAFHYSWSDPSLECAINTLTTVLPVEDPVDTGPTTVPQIDIQKKSFDNVPGRSRDRNPQVHSNKSKKKKELKVPMRVSKRLAGLEPEVLPSERALEYATKKSCKEEPIATATQILTNGASGHLDVEEETKLTCHASHSLKTEVLGESSNKSDKTCNAQTVPKEQLHKVEVENIDERSESQLPVPFGDSWSDPCLEFAFKTLTGALPFDAASDILPVITPDVNEPPNKELHESVVMRTSEEAHNDSNQSQNKELNMVSQPSELFPRQPELRTSSTSCENAPKFTNREPYGDEGYTRNLDGESIHSEVGNVTQLVHHSRDMNTEIHTEPLKENGQVLEGESIITEQPPLETETINHDNSESQFCASFMNSWSDPCLEFAFKTLTGVIPVDENLANQGCFQQPASCHNQTDGGSILPDFGSSRPSQSDIPFHYDMGVNSMSGQQSLMSSPFLPWEKASLQGYPEVDPQKQYSQFNKNFQR